LQQAHPGFLLGTIVSTIGRLSALHDRGAIWWRWRCDRQILRPGCIRCLRLGTLASNTLGFDLRTGGISLGAGSVSFRSGALGICPGLLDRILRSGRSRSGSDCG